MKSNLILISMVISLLFVFSGNLISQTSNQKSNLKGNENSAAGKSKLDHATAARYQSIS